LPCLPQYLTNAMLDGQIQVVFDMRQSYQNQGTIRMSSTPEIVCIS
jgi:hypothetical protein